jgi:hypothetical protein
MPSEHPCGGLPVVGLTLSAWWCEHHQHFSAESYATLQDDAGCDFLGGPVRRLDLGPFDTSDVLEDWMRQRWVDHLNLMASRGAVPGRGTAEDRASAPPEGA